MSVPLVSVRLWPLNFDMHPFLDFPSMLFSATREPQSICHIALIHVTSFLKNRACLIKLATLQSSFGCH